MRRAAALNADLAAQSEKKVSVLCDQPPGLDELAGHIEAPDMLTWEQVAHTPRPQ